MSTLTYQTMLDAMERMEEIMGSAPPPTPRILPSRLITKTVFSRSFKSQKKRMLKKFNKKYAYQIPDTETIYKSRVGNEEIFFCHPILAAEITANITQGFTPKATKARCFG